MKLKTIPSALLRGEGTRLDCGPYMSGVIEITRRIRGGRHSRLAELTAGPYGGVFRPPIFGMKFAQNVVRTLEHGVPFLTSSSMLLSDLTPAPLISRRLATSNKFAVLRLSRGMTLISCSGAIGKMVYVRPDMEGMWSSQAVMKVQPNPETVPPGYVFAFLSSSTGRALVQKGTYGAIVPQIEREHLIDLPVPRLSNELEAEAHMLVDGAANKRSQAVDLLKQARDGVRALYDSDNAERVEQLWSSVSATKLQRRLDAYYFSAACESARRAFDSINADEHCSLSAVAEVFIPGIFKRRYADEPKYGVPYITGGDVFQLAPKSEHFLMHRVVSDNQLEVTEGTILIQEAGQLGGLIGRSVMAGSYLDGFAVSNNMVRVKANDRRDAGFLYALLSTEEGVTLIARESAGSSIPHIDAGRLRDLRLPWPSANERLEIAGRVDEAIRLQDLAAVEEDEARSLVEHSIEAAT